MRKYLAKKKKIRFLSTLVFPVHTMCSQIKLNKCHFHEARTESTAALKALLAFFASPPTPPSPAPPPPRKIPRDSGSYEKTLHMTKFTKFQFLFIFHVDKNNCQRDHKFRSQQLEIS